MSLSPRDIRGAVSRGGLYWSIRGDLRTRGHQIPMSPWTPSLRLQMAEGLCGATAGNTIQMIRTLDVMWAAQVQAWPKKH